jgi:hypothetical protein
LLKHDLGDAVEQCRLDRYMLAPKSFAVGGAAGGT